MITHSGFGASSPNQTFTTCTGLTDLFSRLSPKPPPPLAPPRPRRPPRPGGLPGRRFAPLLFRSGGRAAAWTGRLLLPMETRSLLLHLKLQRALAGEGGATLRRPQKVERRRISEPHLKRLLLPASRFRIEPGSTRLSFSRQAGPWIIIIQSVLHHFID